VVIQLHQEHPCPSRFASLTIPPASTSVLANMTTRAMIAYAAMTLWLPQLALAGLLPVMGTPKFDVAITAAALTDTDRVDPFAADGRARSIVVSSFSPIKNCHHKELESYMPSFTASFQDEKFGAYGLPNGTFQSLSLEVCKDDSRERSPCSNNSFPLVLFSGGLATSRLIYTSMLQSIAAAGYIVISIDHPYDTDIVEFPDGTTVTGLDLSSDAEVELALSTRAEDLAFMRRQMANATVIEMLFHRQLRGTRSPRTAFIGHSLGGAAAAAAMLQDESVSVGLNYDGSMFGDVLTAGLDRPFMLMGHENKTQETDPSWKTLWPRLTGWKKEFEVLGAAHYSFSDLPLIASVLGFRENLPTEVNEVLGTVEGHRMTTIIAEYTTSLLDMVFKSGPEGLLAGDNAKFPEVVVVA
jgi:pimeloyl-ACP methyl ester carboxylesterase